MVHKKIKKPKNINSWMIKANGKIAWKTVKYFAKSKNVLPKVRQQAGRLLAWKEQQ